MASIKMERPIEEVLKERERLGEADIGKVLLNLINRHRFEYRVREIIEYIVKCVCCRRARNNTKLKKHYMFQKCEDKM